METPRDGVCNCGDNRPLYELRCLIAMLERQEAEKKEREEKKAARSQP
jgi:hypothetical protein